VFPVPARAAVCAFSMANQEGSIIYGVAKEKSQAIEEYEAGVVEGKLSGLVEWVTDDGVYTMDRTTVDD
jgi:Vault protein inter-alpha-trypsin domain